LGDRGCEAILIDSWKEEIAVQVTTISRFKPGTDRWNFYAEADIVDGWIVFSGVRRFSFEPSGFIPNEFIISLSVEDMEPVWEAVHYMFTMSVGSAGSVEAVGAVEVCLRVEAREIYLRACFKNFLVGGLFVQASLFNIRAIMLRRTKASPFSVFVS
jgi:hypothetical protein